MKRAPFLVLLILTLISPVTVNAQGTIRVLDQRVEAEFRKEITFHATLESDSPITEVRLFYRVIGLPATARGDAEFQPGKKVEVTFRIDQEQDYLPPGSEMSYWWRVSDEDGDTLKTEPQSFVFMDDRHDWQTLGNDRLTLYWYKGDQGFGEALFDRANKTLDQIESETAVQVENPVKIFIYGSHRDLLDAIEVGAQEWTGGQAFTEHGVVVMDVSPNDLDFGLIATPHELTHIVIDSATDNPYGDLPTWLDEGLAVHMSGELDSPIRGYRDMVKVYAAQDRLMTLQTLSSSFPADAEMANLAYAQSGLVVEFIIGHYGKEAMAKLLDIFAQGSTYDDALTEALGVDTWGLDNAWRESIGVPTIGIPGAATETPSGQAALATSARVPDRSATPTDIVVTPVSKPGGARLPCVGASLVGVAVLVLFVTLMRVRAGS
jgi:hypothetical protein